MSVIQIDCGDSNHPQSTRISTPPIAGKIYFLRLTVEGAFGLKLSRSVASASYASSTATGGKRKKRSDSNKRPCLVLYVENESFSVLLCSDLHGIDPRANDPTKPILLPELSRKEVLIHLLSIHSAPLLVDGNRSIIVTKPNNLIYFPSKNNYYVVLKIIQLPITTRYKSPIDAYFERDELLYINHVICEIKKQKRRELMDNPPSISNIIQNKDDDQSTSSSIPNLKSIFELINHDDFNKSKYIRIQNWLNNSSLSSDLILEEDDLQSLFY